MIDERVAELYYEACKKGYVLFAPQDSRSLTQQFPELRDYKELKDLNPQDLMFVYLFRCATSPFSEIPDKEKLGMCVRYAYKSESVQESKMEEWSDLRFKGTMKAAFEVMKKFNATARILDFVAIMRFRNNCLSVITQDTSKMNDEQKGDYLVRAEKAMKGLNSTTEILERGGKGVVEAGSSSTYDSIRGWLAENRKTPRE